MTNVDFESILIIVIDKCRFWRCDYADFRCRMAGNEDYWMQGEQTSTDLIRVLGGAVRLVQVDHSDSFGSFG